MSKIMLKEPESMDECLYFTNRTIGELGKARAWVYKKLCPKCEKVKMGKPVENGKVRIRAKEYICPECGHIEEKKEHEESLTLESTYTCPACNKEGESTAPYIRKKYKGIPAFVVECQHCGEVMPLTKKLKEPKKKKKK